MRFLRIFLETFCLFFALTSFKMVDRILEGQKGDYIVTEQDRNYSLLLIRHIQSESLLFEEISVPTHLINLSSIRWKQWIKEGAPGHTSWVQYEIDPLSLTLLEGYSFSKKGWLYLNESDQFLAQLLSLPLSKIPSDERKKIGPSLKNDEPDLRKPWNPPVFSEGKKIKTSCDAWKTTWPKDDSLLSCCKIIVYFPSQDISSFPSWIEANNGHFSYAIKVIDSGKNMESSLSRTIPHRPPQLLKHIQKDTQEIQLPIKASPYYRSFTLFAFDLLQPQKKIGPIPFILKTGAHFEEKFLCISVKDLSSLLEKNHRYKWVLMPQSPEAFAIESEDFFRFSSESDSKVMNNSVN